MAEMQRESFVGTWPVDWDYRRNGCSMRKYPSSPKLSVPINLFANQAFYRCRNGRVLRLEPIEQIHLVRREFKIDLLGLLA